jgi:signal transduction histidine kinase/CheY-like chemotaxis protein
VIAFFGPRPIRLDTTMLSNFAAIGRQVGAFFERKRAETERAHLEDQLRQAQKLESLGRLSGGIAHDFNNLLAAIAGNADLARATTEGAAISELLDDVLTAARRGQELVDQILTFARQQPERRVVTSLRPIVEESVRLLRATLPAGVTLTLTMADELPTVRADPTGIQQVIINLCTNAWHAFRQDVGTIRVHLDTLTLDERSARAFGGGAPGTFARILVRDDGKGMTQATLARIFEPFFTTKATGRGTGLGLAAVHGIVKSHDGLIRVESAIDRGTTFEILVPRATGATTAPIMTRPPTTAGNDAEVLYVDDEEMLVRVARRGLSRLGYRVTAMSQAREALAAFTAEPDRFAVVVTDMNMPELSGLDLLREIRRVRADVPVILVSGHLPEEQRREASELGVASVLSKPWAADALGTAIADALSGRKR